MTTIRVWGPLPAKVSLAVGDDRHPMERDDDDWWSVEVTEASAGTDYAFVLDDDDTPLPDPRSACQPYGVHGPSRLVEHAAYQWRDAAWRGIALAGSVIYELHVGTFTPTGTLDAAVEKLDHLVDLGIDIVELMPVASFDGQHGWGYDGVALFAVHEPYGGPDALRRFVDAAHARGLGVVLDVVYNHLGPSGNYLSRFGPYFTDSYVTPWGDAVNYDAPGSDQVRRFVVDNALMWLRDYHVDGLRLDAVHAIVDQRATHVLEELSVAVHALGAQQRRPLFLVAESDRNDPRLVAPREAGGLGVDAQWDDDVHHALHALLTGERQGYYADFGSIGALGTTLTGVFFHDGRYSSFRGRGHGRPVDVERTGGHRFVTFLQDHDQVGNRAAGERSAALMSEGLLKVGAALVLTAPYTPMLFMGEEWAASTPWQFFTSFPDPRLAEAVRAGRRAEFARHSWSADDVPDPQDPATMQRSRLDWRELRRGEHAEILQWHRKLIALRHDLPELADGRVDLARVSYDEAARWLVVRRGTVAIVCNLAGKRQEVPIEGTPVEVLAASVPGFLYRQDIVELDGESVLIVALG